ncbi:unnamed protein product [Caretta caretta]
MGPEVLLRGGATITSSGRGEEAGAVLWVSAGTGGSTTWSDSRNGAKDAHPTDSFQGGLKREADGASEALATKRAPTGDCAGGHGAHWYHWAGHNARCHCICCSTSGAGCSAWLAWPIEGRLRMETGLVYDLLLPLDEEEQRCWD